MVTAGLFAVLSDLGVPLVWRVIETALIMLGLHAMICCVPSVWREYGRDE